MKAKWLGVIAVVVMAVTIIGYKAKLPPEVPPSTAAKPPRVLLAAVLSEANSPGDACAEIIHVVRAARDSGITVQEIDANSQSDLLERYHVIVFPTVLIFNEAGKEIARYEGEGPQAISAVQAAIEQLKS